MSNIIVLDDYREKKQEESPDSLDAYIDVLSLSTDEILATLISRIRGEIFNKHLSTESRIMEAKTRIEILQSTCKTLEKMS